MRIVGRGVMVPAMLLAVALAAGTAAADNNPAGLAFRAVGWFKGKAEISQDGIKCEIPVVGQAITDGVFAMGLWNTFGFATYHFPDQNHPFGNPCGGWIELQNNMENQAVAVDRVELRFKIPGARRFRQSVPTRSGFPIACRELRRDRLFVGAVVGPTNGTLDTGSGAPNVTFIEMLPLVSAQMIGCLREQYAPLPPDMLASLPLVIRATAVGVGDAGDTFRSNSIAYTLNLRHTCGNGRVDDGEMCDPATPFNSCTDECLSGVCGLSGKACTTSLDCTGTCVDANSPSECLCVF
jgi:hypothetical protein